MSDSSIQHLVEAALYVDDLDQAEAFYRNVLGLELDLSRPMLDRAMDRVRPATTGSVEAIQGDIREIDIGVERHDIILAASVLHHLRSDAQWRAVFEKFYRALRPGGAIWLFDLIESSIPEAQAIMWRRYGEYLTQVKDEAYRDQVFAYIEEEDTPRSLSFQLDLLREVGFSQVDVLHKNSCFAAFGAVKNRTLPSPSDRSG